MAGSAAHGMHVWGGAHKTEVHTRQKHWATTANAQLEQDVWQGIPSTLIHPVRVKRMSARRREHVTHGLGKQARLREFPVLTSREDLELLCELRQLCLERLGLQYTQPNEQPRKPNTEPVDWEPGTVPSSSLDHTRLPNYLCENASCEGGTLSEASNHSAGGRELRDNAGEAPQLWRCPAVAAAALQPSPLPWHLARAAC